MNIRWFYNRFDTSTRKMSCVRASKECQLLRCAHTLRLCSLSFLKRARNIVNDTRTKIANTYSHAQQFNLKFDVNILNLRKTSAVTSIQSHLRAFDGSVRAAATLSQLQLTNRISHLFDNILYTQLVRSIIRSVDPSARAATNSNLRHYPQTSFGMIIHSCGPAPNPPRTLHEDGDIQTATEIPLAGHNDNSSIG